MDISQIREKKVANARRRTTVIIVALLLALFVAGMLYVTLAFFGLEQINVYGSNRYLSSDVTAATGYTDKTNLFYLSGDKLAQTLEKEFPYIEQLRVEKDFPHTLNLYVTEAKEDFITGTDGNYFVLSEKMKVLAKRPTVTDDLTFLIYESEKEQVMGTQFAYNKNIDGEVLSSVMAALKKAGIASRVTEIDLTDKFNIAVTYDGRIRIKLGTYEDIETKILFAARIVTEKAADVRGTLYATSTEKATFEADR